MRVVTLESQHKNNQINRGMGYHFISKDVLV